MYTKIGVAGIDVNTLGAFSGSVALDRSGINFGNMLFTKACHSQLRDTHHLGFHFDPDKTRERFDAIAIPAANWINTTEDWGWFADILEKTALPVTLIGLGTQISRAAQIDQISKGTVRFLEVVKNLSSSIGVRGNYSAQVLSDLGFNNVEVLGCPSMFYKAQTPSVRDIEWRSDLRLAISPTRYFFPASESSNGTDPQRNLYRFALQNGSRIYYQSERFEVQLLNRESIEEAEVEKALDYYGFSTQNELFSKIRAQGLYHSDLEHWIKDIKKDDLYVGTRIHGAVAATLAGTPSLLLTHDTRTQELAEVMHLPHCPLSEFDYTQLKEPKSLKHLVDYSTFPEKMEINRRRLAAFYETQNMGSQFLILIV